MLAEDLTSKRQENNNCVGQKKRKEIEKGIGMGLASLGGATKRKVLTINGISPYWQGELLGQKESFRASRGA